MTVSGDVLRGLHCQVRTATSSPVGTFSVSNGDFKTLNCAGGTENAVTHSNSVDKGDGTVSFTWMPPATDMGTLTGT